MQAAPFTITIFKICFGFKAVGSELETFCKVVVRYISLNISIALLLAGPSVPIATLKPLSRNFLTLGMPLASLTFEPGQVTTIKSLFLNISMSVLLQEQVLFPPQDRN